MKEIVIKLNDTDYESLTSSSSVVVELATIRNLVDAVIHGKVLPNGHGELIDARAFLQSINNSDYDTYNDYSNTFDWIEGAETLVEADKGEEE